MNAQLFKHSSQCDEREKVLRARIKAHQPNARDGIGTFKREIVLLRARRRELLKATQPGLPFGKLNSLRP